MTLADLIFSFMDGICKMPLTYQAIEKSKEKSIWNLRLQQTFQMGLKQKLKFLFERSEVEGRAELGIGLVKKKCEQKQRYDDQYNFEKFDWYLVKQ